MRVLFRLVSAREPRRLGKGREGPKGLGGVDDVPPYRDNTSAQNKISTTVASSAKFRNCCGLTSGKMSGYPVVGAAWAVPSADGVGTVDSNGIPTAPLDCLA